MAALCTLVVAVGSLASVVVLSLDMAGELLQVQLSKLRLHEF